MTAPVFGLHDRSVAREHVTAHIYAAIEHVITQVASGFGSTEAACKQFPFLSGYQRELAEGGAAGRWQATIAAIEAGHGDHLPLRALRAAAGLDHSDLLLFATIGLVEEDARFGLLCEVVQGVAGQARPTLGLLTAWFRSDGGAPGDARVRLARLVDLGLVQVVNPDAARTAWAVQVVPVVWDALRGTAGTATWVRHTAAAELAAIDDLVLTPALAVVAGRLPALLAAGQAGALVLRGPRGSGRRTLAGAVAAKLGRGLVVAEGLKADDPRWRALGALSTALHALPVALLEPGHGETVEVPRLPAADLPVVLVLPPQGGLSGAGAERALTVVVGAPGPQERAIHWRASGVVGALADDLAARLRMTGGAIRRSGVGARAYAVLAGRDAVSAADVQQARRALGRQALDALATWLPPAGDWDLLAVDDATRHELRLLEERCRRRESLAGGLGRAFAGLNAGVRALFSGPSGTGKTLAARLLAAALDQDCWRVDLAAVVNKYIGETEKNLNQVFSRAEELDVILLLDEGDALLTARTNVQSANDRYANLETNYLLQRLEGYQGVVVITSNAADRIDAAFQRRMDATVDFRPPGAAERLRILALHLPAGHTVPGSVLGELAGRCALTGGQMRNACLHAALLARGLPPAGEHLLAAVAREYRKAGASPPFALASAATVNGSASGGPTTRAHEHGAGR